MAKDTKWPNTMYLNDLGGGGGHTNLTKRSDEFPDSYKFLFSSLKKNTKIDFSPGQNFKMFATPV